MENKEYNSEEITKEDHLIALDSHFTDIPIESEHSRGAALSIRPKIQLNSANREKSLRSLLMKRTPSEIIKNNILKSKYTKRKEQLKELTHNNVQLFMRIKAQQSHYSLKALRPNIERQTSAQLSKPKQAIPDEEKTSLDRKIRFRCKSAKLMNRCSQLKQSIPKNRREDISTGFTVYTDRDKNDRQALKSRISRLQNVDDKQNQGYNNQQTKVIKKSQTNKQIQRKIIAKKLGFNLKRESRALKARVVENQRIMLREDIQQSYKRQERLLFPTESQLKIKAQAQNIQKSLNFS